jgi:hypothetical protein
MSLALRIGSILVLTPGYTNAVAGATALNVAGGMSGFAGALAPELALAGVAAQPNAVEEAFGQLVGDGFRPEAVTEELGQRWEIGRNYFRLRACCNPIYAALDALEDILTDVRPRPESIERIEVATYRFAANMREPNPANYFAAKYSLPHAAAALVLRGNTGYHAFTEDVVRDPAIAAFRQRITVREDPELNAHVPRLKPARVTVTFTMAARYPAARERPRRLPGSVWRRRGPVKIPRAGGLVLSPAGVARIEETVDRSIACRGWRSWSKRCERIAGLARSRRHPVRRRGPNAGGGTRRFEAASYAEAIFRRTSSRPGSARNTNEKGSPGAGMVVGVLEGTGT